MMANCYRCGLRYGAPEFPDLVIPDQSWARIAPDPNGEGLLCPNCIVARLEEEGLENVPAAFMSGPARTVDPMLMETYMRSLKNG